jgi:hypothetical protein
MKADTPQLPAKRRPPGCPFKPGQSGNPSGKRRGSVSLVAAIKRALLKEPDKVDQIARTLIDGAISGDVGMARLLLDRLDGSRSNPFFSLTVDASDRRAISVSPQTLAEIADARKRYEEKMLCHKSPTT